MFSPRFVTMRIDRPPTIDIRVFEPRGNTDVDGGSWLDDWKIGTWVSVGLRCGTLTRRVKTVDSLRYEPAGFPDGETAAKEVHAGIHRCLDRLTKKLKIDEPFETFEPDWVRHITIDAPLLTPNNELLPGSTLWQDWSDDFNDELFNCEERWITKLNAIRGGHDVSET